MGLRQHEGRESEWKIRSWIEDGRVVAWSWLKGEQGRLEHDVHPEYRHVLDEILAEPAASVAFAFDDDEPMLAALARHGFIEPGEALHFFARDLRLRRRDVGGPPRRAALAGRRERRR